MMLCVSRVTETPSVPWRQQGERPVVQWWRSLYLSPNSPGHVTPGEASAPLQVWGIALLDDTLTPGWWEVCLCHLPVMRYLHLGSCLEEWDCNGERTTPMSAKM